ncbi:unnamed protein product, partial [Candidula unifasciata]
FVRIENIQKDEVVVDGGRAMFLCHVTPPQAHHLGKDLPVAVHWTFAGRRLEIDPHIDGEGHYISKSSDNRHVLVITKARAEDEGEYACVATIGNQTDRAYRKLIVQRPPEPPVDVRVKSCHGNTAEISWMHGKSNGAEILGYTVQFNLLEKPEAWYDSYEESPGDSTQAFVSLAPYGTYSFRVRARNAVGCSRPSSVTSRECTTPPDRPDRNPGKVKSLTDKKGFLVIEWEPLHRLSFHGPGFCYFVLWRRKGSLAWNSATVNGTYASRFEQEVDEVYSLYEFQVKSQNDMGEAHQPAFVYAGRSFEAEPLVTVVGFQLDPKRPMTQTTAHFIWEAVDPNDRLIQGKFRGYKILYRKWDEKEVKDVYIPWSGLTMELGQQASGSVSNLPAFSTFKVQVVVVNSHYQGPPSDTIDIFTPEGTPTAVQGLFADSVTHDSVTLRWLPPERPNGILTGYDIGYQIVHETYVGSLTTVQSQANTPFRLQARINNLKPNHRYRFHVLAKTRTGRGVRSYIDVHTRNQTLTACKQKNLYNFITDCCHTVFGVIPDNGNQLTRHTVFGVISGNGKQTDTTHSVWCYIR